MLTYCAIKLCVSKNHEPISKVVMEIKTLPKLHIRLTDPLKKKKYVNTDGSFKMAVLKSTNTYKVRINGVIYDIRVLGLWW